MRPRFLSWELKFCIWHNLKHDLTKTKCEELQDYIGTKYQIIIIIIIITCRPPLPWDNPQYFSNQTCCWCTSTRLVRCAGASKVSTTILSSFSQSSQWLFFPSSCRKPRGRRPSARNLRNQSPASPSSNKALGRPAAAAGYARIFPSAAGRTFPGLSSPGRHLANWVSELGRLQFVVEPGNTWTEELKFENKNQDMDKASECEAYQISSKMKKTSPGSDEIPHLVYLKYAVELTLIVFNLPRRICSLVVLSAWKVGNVH